MLVRLRAQLGEKMWGEVRELVVVGCGVARVRVHVTGMVHRTGAN